MFKCHIDWGKRGESEKVRERLTERKERETRERRDEGK